MAIEIERKFIARPSVLAHCRSGTPLIQGYLYTDDANTIRIRQAGERMLVTWKGPRRGCRRDEVEFAIPPADGMALLAHVPASRRLEKTRFRVEHAGATWDVDVYGGGLAGLILAEIELEREDQPVTLPPWIQREVTSDARYRNSRLAGNAMPERTAA
ncbi:MULTISPECIES: CYTH domain-containing protein [unclassified Methylobacterium]|jgi:CYTH domain-containing protein|uniref:CYTH domain-containing protein n=1 Tax=unclassified Methylobacterium TaxID=2615210 RepID=UPI0013543B24|nr:CYTH domain-containing protein [Methylobacterium sp. 2A]MWV24884.1 CYTH domain-containing protein [Methylobacterium sp. 2A]